MQRDPVLRVGGWMEQFTFCFQFINRSLLPAIKKWQQSCASWHDSFWCGYASCVCGTWLIRMCDSRKIDTSLPQRDMTQFICMTWLIHMWNMCYPCLGHDSFVYGTWLIRICGSTKVTPDMTCFIRGTSLICMRDGSHSCMGHDSFAFVAVGNRRQTWLVYMWDMSHLFVGHDSFVYGTWLIRIGGSGKSTPDLIYSQARHVSFICGTRLIRIWDMTYLFVGHDLLVCAIWLLRMCGSRKTTSFLRNVTWLICMWDSTHFYVWGMTQLYVGHDSFVHGTWLICMCDSRKTTPVLHSVTWLMFIHAWHDLFVCGTWMIHICDMTPFTCATWLSYMWITIHWYGWQYEKYGVAMISRLLPITDLFCRISSLLQGSFAKETHNFKEPTNHSHPIGKQQSCAWWHDSFHVCDICGPWLIHMRDLSDWHWWQ